MQKHFRAYGLDVHVFLQIMADIRGAVPLKSSDLRIMFKFRTCGNDRNIW